MFAIHRRTQVIGRATAAVLSAALITATYGAVIPAGPNYFETVPAGTSIDFGRANISRGFSVRVRITSLASSACKATRLTRGPLVQPTRSCND